MVKRVVITGGPCSGKTTLINELEKRGYKVLREVARKVLEERKNKIQNKEEWRIRQRVIYESQVIAEKELKCEIHFLDRGIIDAVAYSKILLGEVPFRTDIQNFGSRYNAVFILDRLPLKKDDIRWETEEEAGKVHDALETEYKAFGYNPIAVPVFEAESLDDAINKRAEFLLNSIGEGK